MTRRKQILTAAGTFSAALSIGFIMQYGDAVASRFVPESPAPVVPEMVMPDAVVTTALLPTVPDEAVVIVPEVLVAAAEVPVEAPMMDAPAVITDAVDCSVVMATDVLPGAMVLLALDAPCDADTAVTIHHQGMMFSAMTNDVGQLAIIVPALAKEAFFIASVSDAQSAVATVDVPALANYDRAVVQWQGDNAVELHALEFGAGYDDAGHVWAAAARDETATVGGQGGYLTSLGDASVENALMAEVYTFPTGSSSRDGTVRLSVEAEVSAANCGREIAAQSIQIHPDGAPTAVDLNVFMPGCDAIGEFLVLKNMFEDLTLAAK